MGASRHPGQKRPAKDLLSDILDFGPDSPTPESPDLTERIRKVKEKIEEINERITRLTTRTE